MVSVKLHGEKHETQNNKDLRDLKDYKSFKHGKKRSTFLRLDQIESAVPEKNFFGKNR